VVTRPLKEIDSGPIDAIADHMSQIPFPTGRDVVAGPHRGAAGTEMISAVRLGPVSAGLGMGVGDVAGAS
jgi:hypothetical protein